MIFLPSILSVVFLTIEKNVKMYKKTAPMIARKFDLGLISEYLSNAYSDGHHNCCFSELQKIITVICIGM